MGKLWAKFSEETDKLLKIAKDNPIKPLDTDSKFYITAFKTVAEEFNDEFKAIYEEGFRGKVRGYFNKNI